MKNKILIAAIAVVVLASVAYAAFAQTLQINGTDVYKRQELYTEIPKLPPEQRGEFGKKVNELKRTVEQAVAARKEALLYVERTPIDVTAPMDYNAVIPPLLHGSNGSLNPVSYTHLDVYKRQGVWLCMVLGGLCNRHTIWSCVWPVCMDLPSAIIDFGGSGCGGNCGSDSTRAYSITTL